VVGEDRGKKENEEDREAPWLIECLKKKRAGLPTVAKKLHTATGDGEGGN